MTDNTEVKTFIDNKPYTCDDEYIKMMSELEEALAKIVTLDLQYKRWRSDYNKCSDKLCKVKEERDVLLKCIKDAYAPIHPQELKHSKEHLISIINKERSFRYAIEQTEE